LNVPCCCIVVSLALMYIKPSPFPLLSLNETNALCSPAYYLLPPAIPPVIPPLIHSQTPPRVRSNGRLLMGGSHVPWISSSTSSEHIHTQHSTAHTQWHTHTHTHNGTRTHTHTHNGTRAHAHTHNGTRAHTRTMAHAHTHTHTMAHAHTHAHTHTQ
jgi:hypothetical protein